jgi:hypothetical protein
MGRGERIVERGNTRGKEGKKERKRRRDKEIGEGVTCGKITL